jgi:hypothetical protein
MNTNPDDNIADDPTPITNQDDARVDDSVADEYMKVFDVVDGRIRSGDTLIRSLAAQPDQDHRLSVLMKWASNQQRLNEDMYDLMVRMNNFFAPK